MATTRRMGLVNRVVDDERSQDEASAAARLLAQQPAKALGFIKDNLGEAGTVDFLTSLDGEAERMISAMQSEVTPRRCVRSLSSDSPGRDRSRSGNDELGS